MLRPAPPKSNTERQRRFRKRHPGYFNKYNHRKRLSKRERIALRAEFVAMVAAAEAAQATADAQQANTEAPLTADASPQTVLTLPLPTWTHALPAPVDDPAKAEIEALVATVKARAAGEPLPALLPVRAEAA